MKISDFTFDIPARADVQQSAAVHAETTLEEMFQSVVHRFPERVALAGGGMTMSFAELDTLSSAIANFIMAMHYGNEAIVGVFCKRGSAFLAAAYGVLRAGAVYLPVERELPLARQEIMLKPARLIITDSHCLREADHFKQKHPGILHLLCIDSPAFTQCLEKGTELKSTAYWEHVAEAGSDQGWKSYFDAVMFPQDVLEDMAANILEKSALAGKQQKRVLDIGSGSGVVASALIHASSQYTAMELARNELDRVDRLVRGAAVKVHQMEASDICFLEGEEFEFINLNGIVENFPGYNYLRQVLNSAVQKLSEDGVLFVGAVWDLGKKDLFRNALKEYALTSGNNNGLLRFDVSAELFLSESFFTDWAAESPVPVEISISRPNVKNDELSQYRFDVVIQKSQKAAVGRPQTRFGTDYLFALPKADLPSCLPEQAAYIVYTSGSTGIPKGVVVEHRNLLHIIGALREYAEGCERIALFAPLSFDASIQQMALSLFCDNSLYVLSDAERKSPEMFFECICKNRIDLCDMTPAIFNVLVEFLFERRLSLPISRILLAGEVLRPDTIQKFYSIPGNDRVVLFNVYGPTECTVDTCAYRVDAGNYNSFSAYPIGRAFAGSAITIRDKEGKALPDSVMGEMWISGDGVSRGYLNVDSSAAFVMADGRRCYRTGDYGYTQNGLVFYSGREDQQVKIRGNRVEIGEVENAIAGYPGVKQVAVVADTFRAGEEKTLAAYVVGEVDAALLRSYLEQLLPSYCVPSYYVPMVELPLSINRKVDKKALPSPQTQQSSTGGRRPSGPVEEKMAEIWKRLLGTEVSDADASFFSMGGHSIMAIRLIAMIEKELNVHIAVNELFAHPTIALLSSFFAGKAKVHDSPVIKLCHCEGGRNIFLFHPVGGSVFCYSELAKLLSHKYTVYAVEAAGFRPERTALNTELHKVEELAEYYLEEILKVETKDIIFGGWSFGGLLAYEAACRFEEMGNASGAVVVLDSVADNSKAKLVAAKDDIEMLKSLLQDALGFDETVLRALPREEKLAYLVECGEKTGLLPFGFSSVQMDNLLQTYRGNAIAAARYENPTRSDKEILLVRALDFSSNALIVSDDKYQGWSSFLREENIHLKWTEGTHENMLSPGLVGNVAKHILEYLSHE